MRTPVAKPFIGEEELAKVKEVFKTGWLGMGSVVCEFENALKEYIGCKNIIAVNTGTSALHLALDSLGIGRGDEVIVPSLTFVATPHAVSMCGAKVVFCEVSQEKLNIDIDDVKKRITKKTKAVIPVHYSGFPCDMQSLLKMADEKGLFIVEDAAHAFGSLYRGKMIGSFGHATCFSFDPIKIITCGEGGAIATPSRKLAKTIIRKRIMGIDKDTWSRYKNSRSWFYEVKGLGYRYHMSNINAAIGLVQLKKIGEFIARRRAIAKRYDEALSCIEGIKLIAKGGREEIAQFNYIIRVKKNRREPLMKFLKENGVETGIHYIPNHIQPFYKTSRTRLLITEKVADEILTLPLYYGMSDTDVNKVIDLMNDFFRGEFK